MTLEEWEDEISRGEKPPQEWTPLLRALWFEWKGDWETAHRIAQEQEGADAAWVHAYLHRKEGDTSNAGYWYRRAGRVIPRESLSDEWRLLAGHLLEK